MDCTVVLPVKTRLSELIFLPAPLDLLPMAQVQAHPLAPLSIRLSRLAHLVVMTPRTGPLVQQVPKLLMRKIPLSPRLSPILLANVSSVLVRVRWAQLVPLELLLGLRPSVPSVEFPDPKRPVMMRNVLELVVFPVPNVRVLGRWLRLQLPPLPNVLELARTWALLMAVIPVGPQTNVAWTMLLMLRLGMARGSGMQV